MKIINHFIGAAMASLLLTAPAVAVDIASITFAQLTQQPDEKIMQFGNTDTSNTPTITIAPAIFVVAASNAT